MTGISDFGFSVPDEVSDEPKRTTTAQTYPTQLPRSDEMVGNVPADAYRVIYQEDRHNPTTIASEIVNRQHDSNGSLQDVIYAHGQYGPGMPGSKEGSDWAAVSAIPMSDPRMQSVIQASAPILSGQESPTNTFRYHYSPEGQRLWHGGKRPDFAVGEGTPLGGNVYYSTPYKAAGAAADDEGSVLGPQGFQDVKPGAAAAPTKDAGAGAPPAAGQTAGSYTITGGPKGGLLGYTTPGQTAAINADKERVEGAAAGTRGNPYGMGPDQNGVLRGGEWYYPKAGGPAVQYQEPDSLLRTAAVAAPTLATGLIVPGAAPFIAALDPRVKAASDAYQNNLLFGAQSKIEGAGAALSGGDYNQTVAAGDLMRNQERARFPITYDIGAVGGSIAGAAAGGEGLAAGARALPGLAGDAARFATGTMRTGSRLTDALANAPGAAGQGAVYGMASGTGGSRADTLGGQLTEGVEQAVPNAILGGVVHGGLGVGGAARDLVGAGANSFVSRWSPAARDRMVADRLHMFGGGDELGPPQTDFTEYVPGSHPTLAQATTGPNRVVAAATERTMRKEPTVGAQFDDVHNENDRARKEYIDPVISTPEDMQAGRTAARNELEPMRKAVFANKNPTDPTPALDKIDAILASPDGQIDAVRSALTNVRDKVIRSEAKPAVLDKTELPPRVVRPAQDRVLETDPEQLWGIRQDIDAKLARPQAYPDAKVAAKQLGEVRDALTDAIGQGAPGNSGFQAYSDLYREKMKPFNAQGALQEHGWTDTHDNYTLAKVTSGLRKLEAERAVPYWTPAKDISDEDMGKLYNLHKDLLRADLNPALKASGRGPQITGNVEEPPKGILNALTSPAAAAIGTFVASHGNVALAGAIGAGRQMAQEALDQRNKLVDRAVVRRVARPDENNPYGLSTTARAVGPQTPGLISKGVRAVVPLTTRAIADKARYKRPQPGVITPNNLVTGP